MRFRGQRAPQRGLGAINGPRPAPAEFGAGRGARVMVFCRPLLTPLSEGPFGHQRKGGRQGWASCGR